MNNDKKDLDIVLYNLQEIADILEVTTRTVLNYIYDNKLKAVKIGGKWKITKENLEAFIKGE